MTIKKMMTLLWIFFFLCLIAFNDLIYAADNEGIGQTIEINTRFHSFVGRPLWLLVIRDLDHNQNISYLYDIHKGENFWIALTYGKQYLILASTLQIQTYGSRDNRFKKYTINNFCHLESHGKIMRGVSLFLNLEGDLTVNDNSINCQVSRFFNPNFT
jgi:hypothetical protein